MDTDSHERCQLDRRRRHAREEWLSHWSHVWARRRTPDWQPRRASVATCQQQQRADHQQARELAQHQTCLTTSSSIRELINRDDLCHKQQLSQRRQQHRAHADQPDVAGRDERAPADQGAPPDGSPLTTMQSCAQRPPDARVALVGQPGAGPLAVADPDDERPAAACGSSKFNGSTLGPATTAAAASGSSTARTRRRPATCCPGLLASRVQQAAGERAQPAGPAKPSGPAAVSWSACSAQPSASSWPGSAARPATLAAAAMASGGLAALAPDEQLNEKLHLQDKQRKYLIFSMALKQMAAGQAPGVRAASASALTPTTSSTGTRPATTAAADNNGTAAPAGQQPAGANLDQCPCRACCGAAASSPASGADCNADCSDSQTTLASHNNNNNNNNNNTDNCSAPPALAGPADAPTWPANGTAPATTGGDQPQQLAAVTSDLELAASHSSPTVADKSNGQRAPGTGRYGHTQAPVDTTTTTSSSPTSWAGKPQLTQTHPEPGAGQACGLAGSSAPAAPTQLQSQSHHQTPPLQDHQQAPGSGPQPEARQPSLDQKVAAMRQLIMGKDDQQSSEFGATSGDSDLGWPHDHESPADSCELDNDDVDEDEVDERDMEAADGDTLDEETGDKARRGVATRVEGGRAISSRSLLSTLAAEQAGRSGSVQSKSSAISDDLFAFGSDDYNLESLIVESWLDDHPDFAHDYFMRKANHQLIDDWLITHAKVSNSNLASSRSRLGSQQSLLGSHTAPAIARSQQPVRRAGGGVTDSTSTIDELYAGAPPGAGAGADGDNNNGADEVDNNIGAARPKFASDCSWPDSGGGGGGGGGGRQSCDASGPPSCSGRAFRSNSQSAAGHYHNHHHQTLRNQQQQAQQPHRGTMTPVRKISATDFESRTGSGFLRPMLSTTPDGRLTFLSQPSAPPSAPPMTNDVDQSFRQHNAKLARRERAPAAGARDQLTGQLVGDWGSLDAHLAGQPGSAGERALDHELGQAVIDDDAKLIVEQHQHQHQAGGPSPSSSWCSTTVAPADDLHAGHHQARVAPAASVADQPEGPEDELPPGDGEVKLIFELVKNICDDLDIRTLLHKILKNIAVLINADKSSLFLVCGAPNQPDRHLVSQLFNVDQDSSCDDEPAHQQHRPAGDDCIRIPWGTGLVGYVAKSGESLNIANCYNDPRFTNSIDQRTGYVTKHMLCAPIFDNRNEIVGVAQVINKRDGNPFSRSDEIKFKRYLQFCGIGLRNAQSYEHCQLENRRNQVLLDLARMVFEEQSTIEQVVYRIMLHTQSLLECERCQVLLIDDGSEDLDQLLKVPSSIIEPASQRAGPMADHRATATGSSRSASPSPPKWRPQVCLQHLDSEGSVGTGAAHCRRPRSGSSSSEDDCGPAAGGHLSASCDRDHQHVTTKSEPMLACNANEPSCFSSKLFSLVFDLECDGNDPVLHSNREDHKSASCGANQQQQQQQQRPQKKANNRRFPINVGITGYVAMTGETLNIEDAHSHERFDPSADEGTDFRHKSILCMPIRNGKRQIIGVSQLINKKNGRPFNKNDEDLFEAFAIFCGLGIHNTLMYERVLKVMAKQKVTFEVLSYHATAPLDEAKKLSMEQIPSCYALNLASLKFNDFSLDEQYMLKSCLRFFLDLDLMRRFQIDQLVLCNWILSVQKNYRKVTYHPIVGGNGLKETPVRYHNWRHAFNVSQMMFAILVNTQICQALGELETLALLIACLCHDLDHRGTNNSFQIKTASPLADLYSTSTMEHHHFDQCVMILNSQGNQILANLSPAEYSRVVMLLEEAILATDLANYFQRRDLFFQLVNGQKFDWQHDPDHRSLLRCMLMTACDVAAITKPWPVQKVVADLVMSEFYQQGDIERNELNIEPIDMMNRDKMNELPEMQISFIDSICAPIYTAFAKLFPQELSPLIEGCLANRSLWTELANNNVQQNGDQENKSN